MMRQFDKNGTDLCTSSAARSISPRICSSLFFARRFDGDDVDCVDDALFDFFELFFASVSFDAQRFRNITLWGEFIDFLR